MFFVFLCDCDFEPLRLGLKELPEKTTRQFFNDVMSELKKNPPEPETGIRLGFFTSLKGGGSLVEHTQA